MNMKRNKLVLSITIMFFLTLLIPAQNTYLAADTNMGNSRDSHTVLGEESTAPWCQYCPSASYYLYQCYLMGLDFYEVTLVDDVGNNAASGRIGELGVTGYPTVDFDGGYTHVVGGQTGTTLYVNAINACHARTVEDIDLSISAAWMGGGQIQISAVLHNDEASSFSGHLHVYVTEIVSRWDDYSGVPYHFAMLDNWGINQAVTISPQETVTVSNLWSGPTDIVMSNIKVIGSIFKSSNMFTVETAAVSPQAGNTDPPSTPGQPSGPSSGYVGIDYTYSTSSTEPNGDSIKYGWDWNDDNTIDEWTDYYPSGQTASITHSWDSTGTYNFKVKAQDIFGDQSAFSTTKSVNILIGEPPLKPSTPSGNADGMHSKTYSYSTSTTDPNAGDQIFYKFDWDDLSPTDWIGPYDSGESASASHKWNKPGSYDIKVKAKDLAGSESEWSNPKTVERGNTAPDEPEKPDGPTSGTIGIEYTYTTYTVDPEKDSLEYLFEWGDSKSSGWIKTQFAAHTWLNPGEYGVRVKARDQWAESTWSSFRMVSIDEGSIDVEIQVEPDSAMVGDEIQFNAIPTKGSEPYTFKWDFGDGNNSTLQNPTHIYSSMGQFTVSVSVKDRVGDLGSNYTTVDIILTHPPEVPTITSGPNQIIVEQESEYKFSAIDPDSDTVYIMVDWGDNSEIIWHGPYSSGQQISLKHIWQDDGSYNIKIKSKDIHEYESDWSQSHPVNVIWNQAFLFGKHEIINQTEDKIVFKALSIKYLTSDPFRIKIYNNEESIIVSTDSTGFIGKGFVFGKFLVAYIPD
ncbi:MAG: PKD domain-containing protein [Candidatus Thermoplasmatota archaeon]|nr:PKD domain-containing protein [Candidatus Thermoplasmatota archaeon]